MKKQISIFIFLLAFVFQSNAQKFVAQASKLKVAAGETFQISYILNASGGGFKAPPLFDFDVYGGPNQSQSVSIVNGNMTQTISWSFILAAKKEGKFTIAPATVNSGGTKVESNSLTIEVVKGNSGSSQGNGNPNPNVSSPSTAENIGDNLFVKTIVGKTKAFLGEQISVTHKIYTRYQLRGFQDIKFPDYTGFWSQDVPSNNQQIQLSTENIDGVNYYVAELKHSFLFPQQVGKLKIEPIVVEAVVRKKANRQPRDIFEQMMGVGYEDAVYTIKSSSTTIEVESLPEFGKPVDYNGAVGDFSCKVQLSRDKVKANEAINLVITLNGKGNIKLVDAPKINFPEDFEVYDPKVSEKISVTGVGVMGSKTFDYLIIPRHEGDFKIDQIHFSYFDTQKKDYVSVPSPEFSIHVDRGDASSSNASVFSPKSKEEVKVLGEDIRYIKTKTELRSKNDFFFGSFGFYAGILMPLLSFIIFLIIRKKQNEKNKDVNALKSRMATKLARKQLSVAEKHKNSNEKEKFYIEVSKALFDYISNKLNLPLSELNKENIQKGLFSKNVGADTINKLMVVIDTCEFAKYAPGSVKGEMNDLYENTVQLITSIENELK